MIVWTELKINAKRVLIGNIYIPSCKIEQVIYLTDFWKTREKSNYNFGGLECTKYLMGQMFQSKT